MRVVGKVDDPSNRMATEKVYSLLAIRTCPLGTDAETRFGLLPGGTTAKIQPGRERRQRDLGELGRAVGASVRRSKMLHINLDACEGGRDDEYA